MSHATPVSAPDRETIRLLVVEGDTAYALFIREELETASGLAVDYVVAQRLSDGIEKARVLPFDVALLDLHLPDSDGPTTFETFHAAVPALPVVVLSGSPDSLLAADMLRLGAQDFISKSRMHEDLLARTVKHAIARHMVVREVNRQRLELLRSEMRVRTIIEACTDALLIVDAQGLVQFANPAAASMFGLRSADLIGEPFGLPIAPDEHVEIDIRRADRSPGVAEMRAVSIEWETQSAKLVALRDITQRKDHERKIERLNRLHSALGQIKQTIMRADQRESVFGEAVRVLVQVGGLRAAWIGLRSADHGEVAPLAIWNDIPASAADAAANDRLPRALVTLPMWSEKGHGVCNAVASLSPDDPWRHEALRCGLHAAAVVPFCNDDGTLGCLAAFATEAGSFGSQEVALLEELASDLTFVLRHFADEADRRRLEAHNRQLAEIVDASSDAIIRRKLDGTIASWNGGAERLFGYRAEEVLGGSLACLIPSRLHREYAAIEERLKMGHEVRSFETVRRCRDGREIHVSETVSRLRDATGSVVGTSSILRDITERKQAEQKLRQQAALLDQASDAIYVRTLTGVIEYWNDGAARLYGLTQKEVLGRNAAELAGVPGPGDEAEMITLRDGSWAGEQRHPGKTGGERTSFVRLSLLRDAAGSPLSIFVIATDITERKALEEQFLRTQRLESLGLLAAGIAHDFNNVLTPITIAVSLLRDGDLPEDDRQMLESVEQCARRGAGLVRQILGFARGVGGDMTPLQPADLIRDLASVIAKSFPKSITIQNDLPDDCWPILANPTQIHQVLLNLCVNARDAMPEGGRLVLRARNQVLDEEQSSALVGAMAGRWLVVEVQDNGTGIPDDVVAQIWDPFFSTKGPEKGTGLGLSTVRGIVARHGGFTTLETGAGRGTTFRVYLPAVDLERQTEGAEGPSLTRGAGELILLIDDEDNIRTMASAILTKFGYRVITAVDGEAGIAAFREHKVNLDLVITDFDMPKMNGADVIKFIRAESPDMRILPMSGMGSREANSSRRDFGPYMAKPFTVASLLEHVHDKLGSKSS